MRSPAEIAGMVRLLAQLPEHVQQREELEGVALLVEKRASRLRFGCCHGCTPTVELETTIDYVDGALRLGVLPQGWRVKLDEEGRGFMIECPATHPNAPHGWTEDAPASPPPLSPPADVCRAVDFDCARCPRLLTPSRGTAGCELGQSVQARLECLKVEAAAMPGPAKQPIDILTRLEDHLAFLEWLLESPLDLAAVLAGELKARELVGRYERRNDPPAAPAAQGD